MINENQDHLLGEIVVEDSSEKCLLESRKIESKIEQRYLKLVAFGMINICNYTRCIPRFLRY